MLDSFMDTVQSLMEMSYQRKRAIDMVADHAHQLALHMILVHHARDERNVNHWKGEINGFLGSIDSSADLKKGRRLKHNDFNEHVFEGPMGEYHNYTRKHANLMKTKPESNLTPASPEDYEIIKKRYHKAVEMFSGDKSPSYSDIEH